MTEKEFYKEVTKDMLPDFEDIKTKSTVTPIKPKRRRLSTAAGIIIGILLFGGIGTAAAFTIHNWSTGLNSAVDTDKNTAIELEREGYFNDYTDNNISNNNSDNNNSKTITSTTVNGVTIAVKQSLVDNYFAHVIFSISGFDRTHETDITPSFENVSFTIGGDRYSAFGEFYCDHDKLLAVEKSQSYSPYILTDGTMEYHVACHVNPKNKGAYLNKPFHAQFQDLNNGLGDEIPGTWTLDWNLGGCDKSVVKKLDNVPIGDEITEAAGTEITVSEVEYSPISLRIKYHVAEGLTKIASYSQSATQDIDPDDSIPPVYGVELKDGTIERIGGQGGYGSGMVGTDYERLYGNSTITDVDNVVSILFLKKSAYEKLDDENYELTSEDFYHVRVTG